MIPETVNLTNYVQKVIEIEKYVILARRSLWWTCWFTLSL